MTLRPLLAAVGAAACLAASAIAWQRTSSAAEPTHEATDPPAASALDGASLFAAKGCGGCHDGPDSTSMIGGPPRLVGAADWAGERRPGLSAAEYLTESIREPGAYLAADAGFAMPYLALTEVEVAAVVDYLLAG